MVKWRVRFALWTPFAELSTDNKTVMNGVAADFYVGFHQCMNFDYDVMVQPDFTFGRRQPDNSWNGMIGAMINNETDISGPYFMSEERSTAMQFAFPLAFAQLGIVSGLERSQRGAFLLLGIFSLQVWMALITTAIIVASAASTIYHTLPSASKRGKAETFSKYIWTFQTALLGKGLGENESWHLKHVGSSTSFRLLQCLWCTMGCVVLMNTYQGTIMSTFAVDKVKPKIQTLDDLLTHKRMAVGAFKGSFMETFLSNFQGTKYDSIWQRAKKSLYPPFQPGKIQKWIDKVEDGKLVFFSEQNFMKNLVGQRFLSTGSCKIRVTSIHMGSNYLGLAVRKELSHSKILKDLNKGLRYFFEGDLAHRRIAKSTIHYETCSTDSMSGVNPLKLGDVFGAFLILAIGNGASIVLFVIEMMVAHSCRCRKRL